MFVRAITPCYYYNYFDSDQKEIKLACNVDITSALESSQLNLT